MLGNFKTYAIKHWALYIFLFFSFPSGLNAETGSRSLEELKIQLMSNDRDQRIKVMRRLYDYSGISDEALFDPIHERLMTYKTTVGKKNIPYSEELSWATKALASSGNNKYKDTVMEVAKQSVNARLRRHADNAAGQFTEFKIWNSIYGSVNPTSAQNSKERIDAYSQLLDIDNDRIKIAALKRLYDYSGITDSDLFNKIEAQLLAETQTREIFKATSTELMAWQIKALASSGNDKYIELFEKLLNSPLFSQTKLIPHTKSALAHLPEFKQWNQVLAGEAFRKEGRPHQVERWLNLLASQDIRMMTYATRQAYGFDDFDPAVVDAVTQHLEKIYDIKTKDDDKKDFQAWACRYIAQSKDEDGVKLVIKVSQKSPNAKVRTYAKSSLKR